MDNSEEKKEVVQENAQQTLRINKETLLKQRSNIPYNIVG